ncbi:MAG: FtsX-like permease family protein [Bacteroidetes bacterium]|nr:FtsX-like permease family protein [Bacteroidota bacterium]
MWFPLFIARRYLLARKSHNIINLVSGISMTGVAIGTMALIIVLSVFNGFESLVTRLFNSFNPDFVITANTGKGFSANTLFIDSIAAIPGVSSVSPVLEEKALIKYRTKQNIVTLKGVEANYGRVSGLDTMLVDGSFIVEKESVDFAVCGYGIAYLIDLAINDFSHPVEIYFPRRGNTASLDPSSAFNMKTVFSSGVFSVQQEFDSRYVFVSIELMRKLMDNNYDITSLEIRTNHGSNPELIQEKVTRIAGQHLEVKNRFQQEALLYKIMRTEKWAIFLILTFILIVATFNVIGSITMLILEKKKDIAILFSLGANEKEIRRIFLLEGWLISVIGSLAGLFLGFVICWLQKTYGIVSLGGDAGAFLVQSYPVKMKGLDFLYVFATVLFIGLIAAWVPVRRISQQYLEKRFLSN